MKIAIMCLSNKGLKLSKKLKKILDDDSTIIKSDIFYKNVGDKIKIAFYEYDAIIAIMASGILIRSIANLLDSKTTDPGILNIDENAKFVISLLSGHIGGANALTQKIASYLNAEAVITTASDINDKIAIDYLANIYYLNVLNPEKILYFNKAILENEIINLFFNRKSNFNYLIDFIKELNYYKINYDNDISKNEFIAKIDNHELIIKERELVLGIGSRRGKTCKDIYHGLKIALNNLKLPITRINSIATGDMKKNEKGIIDLAVKLEIPLKIVNIEKLKLFKSPDCSTSQFVKSNFGIFGVSEQSALIAAGFNSKLIYKKTAFGGVTIAFAISK